MNVFLYRVHVDTVSEEKIAQVGGISVEAIRLQRGESLQDMKSCVLQALSDEAQAQVHGICKKSKKCKLLSAPFCIKLAIHCSSKQ